jgi:hypothetical protein
MQGKGSRFKSAVSFSGRMLLWAVKIILAPLLIPLWYIPKGIYLLMKAGVRRYIWDEFLSYILGTVTRDRDTGQVQSIRFVTYGDLVHFYQAILGAALCAIFAAVYPSARDILAPLLVIVPIMALIIVKFEFPFDKIWKQVVSLLILIPLADYGIFKGTQVLTASAFPWLESNAPWLGITAEMAGGYEAVWLLKKVFVWFAFDATPGLHLFAAIAWTLFWIGTVGEAWVWNRYEIDEKDLYRKQLFKGESREPVYMRGIRIVIKDVLETFPAGFASLVIRINGRDRVLRNIPGLAFKAWLRGAMDELINSSSPAAQHEHSTGAHSATDRDEELVRTFKEERGGDSEDSNKVSEADHLGDHDITHEDHDDESDDLSGIQDDLDAEERL